MADGSRKGRSKAGKSAARAKPSRARGAKPKPKPAAPALGNDPFTRGAALRTPAPRLEPVRPAPAPVAAPSAEAALPPVTMDAATPPSVPAAAHASIAEAAATATRKLRDVERRAEDTLAGLEHRLHDLASFAGLGGRRDELRVALARLLPALLARAGALAELFRVLEPPARLDRYGMDPRFVERAAPVLEFLYSTWWRVEARYLDRVPASGPALVVANHAGALPWDALVLRHALRRERPGRELRPLLDDRECALPVFGPFAIRAGAVRASPEAVERLLADGALVGVFPEGGAAAEKPWGERYRIQRFGRGGFAKLALRAGAPIIPCSIVGAEEATPAISRPGFLAERLGLPMFAATPKLRVGPAGLIPLPAKWTIRFGDAIEASGGAAAADDPTAVLALTERVRSRLQEMVDEDVAGRRSVFL